MIRVRSIVSALLIGALAAAEMPAWADDSALAEALFQEGKKLFDQGSYAAACPKVKESFKLDPAGGTILLLGLCHEAQGKLASAWAELADAQSQAKRDGRADRERIARDHLAKIEPKLAKLTVDVPAATRAIAGLRLEKDGERFPDAAIGVSVPVDPGTLHLKATAPGYDDWSTDVVATSGKSQSVTVGPLRKSPEAAPSASAVSSGTEAPPPPPEASGSSRRTVAYVVGGVSIAALATGGVFGVLALGKKSDANKTCPDKVCADPAARDASKTAVTDANVANVGLGLGLVGMGVAVVLLATAPKDPKPDALRVVPRVGRTGGGVDLSVGF